MTVLETSADLWPVANDNRARPRHHSFSLRGRVALGVVLGIALVGGVFGWAASQTLAGAVIASGTVLVDGEVKAVQQVDGGIVKSILVKDGDHVEAGQVLVRMDDVQIGTDRDILLGQLGELLGREARLSAERDLEQQITFPPDFATTFPDAAAVMAGEQKLFDGGLRTRKSQKDQLQLQVSQLTEQINGLLAQQQAQADELALARKEREGLSALASSKLVEGSRVTALDRDIARMTGQAGQIRASIAQAQGRVSEINLQILAIDETARTEAQRELRSVEAQVGEVEDRLHAASDRLARAAVRAPVTGTVNELAIHTEGGVITPAQTLMTIVPSESPLTVEFRIATRDIDQISVGQRARLRFSAFNRRTTPEIKAEVTRVSAAPTRDPVSGENFYTAQVRIDGDLTALDGQTLLPGMPVEVYVETQEQVAIAYFLKPFTDQIARAFKEE